VQRLEIFGNISAFFRFGCERLNGVLKRLVRNKARPVASIVTKYVVAAASFIAARDR
jgi:hypothetical protein